MSKENNLFNFIHWQKLCFFACWLLLFSCNTTKYLQDDEAFLQKNEIKFISKQKIKKQKKLTADLLSIVKQKPNTNFLLISRRWFHYKSKKKDKKSKPIIAEYPSIYNETITEETAKSMADLLYQKGYYNAKVSFETKINQKKAAVSYIVEPRQLYIVDTIQFASKDTAIQKILNGISKESVLKKGAPVSIKLFEEEKQRIRSHLRNVGYRNFYANSFDQLTFSNDTSKIDQLSLYLEIFPINDTTFHQTYQVGEVYVYPYYTPQVNKSILKDTLINGIHFMLPENLEHSVRPDVIANRIFLKKGALYSQSDYDKTVRNLGELGIFKFANIDEKIVADTTTIINFNIYLPPNQRRSIGGNLEYKNTSLRDSPIPSPNLNGLETSLSYQDKNAFGGSEVFNANLGFGIQVGNSTTGNFIDNFDISPRFDLSIPKFRDLFGFVRLMNGIGVFSDKFYESLLDNANTRLSLGLNFTQRRNFWQYFNTDLSLGYEIQNNPNRSYFVKQLGINIFQPTIEPGSAGAEAFEDNPFLERTFNQDQLFTGLLFREFGFSFAGRNLQRGTNWRLFFNSEVSGTEILLANAVANQFRTEEPDTLTLLGLDFAKFVRVDVDLRLFKSLRPTRTFAFRANLGIAAPFGISDDVPYVKQFFAGGANSVRAWRVRELGPGSYRDPVIFPSYQENAIPFYQTGDFKFIFSAEYRFLFFQLFGFDWESTVFLDGGNVWTLREDPDRPGSQLTPQSWREIALGTGTGLNIDFEYFILRLDLGYKLRNPFPNPNGTYWAIQEFRELGFRGINYNLGVGRSF